MPRGDSERITPSLLSLPRLLSFQGDRTSAAGWTLGASAQRVDVDLKFLHSPAECVAVHTQLARRFALIAAVFFENRDNETLLKFTHRF